MHKRQTVALQLLENESFAAEEAHAKASLQRDADGDPLGRAEKRVLLADHRPPVLQQIERQDLARIRCSERHPRLPRGPVAEHRHEQRLAGQDPFPSTHELAQEARVVLTRSVAKDGPHLDTRIHVHEGPGFGYTGLRRIQRLQNEKI